MKKSIIALLIAFVAVSLFVGCKPDVKTYTVTFDSNGGSKVGSQTVEEGNVAKKPAAPTKDGYEFVRWSAVEKGESAFDFNTKITKDMTLYAVWTKVYKVGDKGPAGGYIFYDKGSYSDGWRYLEVATKDAAGTGTIWESGSSYENHDTKKEIGTGKANTNKLLAVKGKEFPAAKACADYGNNTEYDDWFLPSLEELKCLANNKSKLSDLSLDVANYWTSSEYSDSEVYSASIDWEGNFVDSEYDKNSNQCVVRPVRSF